MDPIRRQLKFLDDRLRKRSDLGDLLFTRSPFLLGACSFIAGIVIRQYLRVGAAVGLVLVVLSAIAMILSVFLSARVRLRVVAVCACICFMCLGMVRLESFYTAAGNDIRNVVTADDSLATIRGIVKTNVKYENRRSWRFGRYQFMPPGCSFYMNIEQIKVQDRWADVCGIVRVQLSGEANNIEPGDRIQVYCRLSRFSTPLNPGQFDIKKSMERRNIYISASVKSAGGIELLQKAPSSSFRRIAGRVKTIASEALLDEHLADDSAGALLAALLLGERSDIDSETAIAFQKTNLAHFISLSGMHLGILAATFWWMCRTAGLSKRLRAITCAAIIGVYMLIVPPRAPTLRAAVICWVFCLAVLVRRKPNSVNTLAMAAVVLLLIKPTELFTAGWQLSYTSVLGILLLQQPIANWALERTVDRIESRRASKSKTFTGPSLLTTVLSWVIELFATGLAAWLGGAGVLLYHFGTIGPMASVWTVLVFPLVWLILVLGFVKMLLAFFLPTVAMLIGLVLVPLANSLAAVVRFLAETGLSQIIIGRVTPLLILCYYGLVLITRFAWIEKRLLRKAIHISMIVVIILPLVIVKYNRTHTKDVEVTTLSAGHGQAIFIRMPSGANILLDAGSLGTKDPGSRIVTPFLRYSGINNIDSVILSHGDSDHINGVPEIISSCNVGSVCANAAVLQKASTSSMAGYLSYCLKNMNYDIELLDDTLTFKNGATIRSLWPDPNACDDPALSDNDKSQVVLIEFAGRKVLLTSDIELHGQEQLLARYPGLNVDVLVMPHHGSKRNLVDGFAEKVGAETVIISCSRTRRATAYEPPPAIKAFYTPVDGATTTKIKADGSISTVGFVDND